MSTKNNAPAVGTFDFLHMELVGSNQSPGDFEAYKISVALLVLGSYIRMNDVANQAYSIAEAIVGDKPSEKNLQQYFIAYHMIAQFQMLSASAN